MALKWEILIASLVSRRAMLNQLLDILCPQLVSGVEVLVHENEGGRIGDIRERVRKLSTAEYISWIDDDDLVPSYYVSEILPRLDGVDIIGWESIVYRDGVRLPQRDYHTIAHGGWFDDADFHRDISHLQPIRRELAMSHPMEGGVGEDSRWANRMRGLVKTEHYIDRIMYHYVWRTDKHDDRDATDPFRLRLIEKLREPQLAQ